MALSIAGSDCSAGAGIQADLKTFEAMDVYGLTASTCAVSEVPGRVSTIEALPPAFVRDQVLLLCRSFPVAAAKTGMMPSAAHAEAAVNALEDSGFPESLVVDPVMVATSGQVLVSAQEIDAFESLLFTRASLLTPNMDEAGALLGKPVRAIEDFEDTARRLRDRFGCAILLKGGHLGGETATDLFLPLDDEPELLQSPFVPAVSTHGTGCTLSAAIAAGLAHGRQLGDAVRAAKAYVTRAIRASHSWDSPAGPVHAINHRV
ncbi:MAG: bifunctional hydroxymethylpyrimidine kinase/phosphomethylpyrimidine kinase [Verrucomicrobiales bacterium]